MGQRNQWDNHDLHEGFGLGRDEGARAAAASGNFAEWSVPWSDLMMIMFMVFAMLFVYSSSKDRPVPVPPQKAEQTKAPTDPMQGFLGELTAPAKDKKDFQNANGSPQRETFYQSDNLGIQVVRETDRQVRVFLRGDLFFSPGGDELAGASAPYLGRISEILRVSSGAILVVGHATADEAPTPEDGLALSARRAASVASYFIRNAGIDPKRMIVTGRGSFQPEAPNAENGAENGASTNADKRNRRVEVLVLTDI